MGAPASGGETPQEVSFGVSVIAFLLLLRTEDWAKKPATNSLNRKMRGDNQRDVGVQGGGKGQVRWGRVT